MQLIGKQCVNEVNARASEIVDDSVVDKVIDDLKMGVAFPILE